MGIKSLCTDLFCELLETVVPNRTKRLIMLSSLCPVVTEKEELTDEYLTLLNTQLSLCREEDAIKFPLSLSHSIWKDLSSEGIKTGNDNEKLVYQIMSTLPQWLKYDREDVIQNEIRGFLRFNSMFRTAYRDNGRAIKSID